MRRLPSPPLLTPPASTSTSRSSDDLSASTCTGVSLAVKSNGGVGGGDRDGIEGWLRSICQGVSSTILTRELTGVFGGEGEQEYERRERLKPRAAGHPAGSRRQSRRERRIKRRG
ncbi:unnamed protein product [Sphacelaria rigidula]